MMKKIGPWAGMLGPALFALTFTLNGLLRPGYHPVRMYVSELSIGPQGWIQQVNFMVLGLCLAAFAVGVSKAFPAGKASRAGPVLLGIIAACYFISGPLVTDPAAMFDNQRTVHGFLHGIFGALVFSLSPACCFVFLRRFRADAAWRRMRPWTLLAGIVMALVVVLMKIAQPLPSPLNPWAGLIQRCSMLTFYAWVITFALGLKRRSKA